jgi:hypothetical protein
MQDRKGTGIIIVPLLAYPDPERVVFTAQAFQLEGGALSQLSVLPMFPRPRP